MGRRQHVHHRAARLQGAKGAAIPKTSTPAEFDALIKADYKRWGAVVRKLGLKLD